MLTSPLVACWPVEFLESRFPHATREIGKTQAKGTKCVELRVPADSPEFKEISRFVNSKRALGLKAFAHFPIASYLRKYRKDELQNAEALLLKISAHFEPSGKECGTVYETICKECNMGRQAPTEWDGSDIATTSNLFGQGRNLLRPAPLIIISQRLYRALISMGAKGFSAEPVHFVD